MCDPLTIALISGATSLGASLLGPALAKPPKAEIPAVEDTASSEAATVRVGDAAVTDPSKIPGSVAAPVQETRVFGRPVGGLGRSGLSI